MVARLVPEPARDSMVALGLGIAFVVLGIGIIAYGAHEFQRTSSHLAGIHSAATAVRPRNVYILTAVIAVLLLAVLGFLWTHRGTA